MHLKSDNIEIMINDEADKVIEELLDSLKNRYQNNLKSMKGSESVFDYVMNIWMIGKNSIKLYYLKKKIFIAT